MWWWCSGVVVLWWRGVDLTVMPGLPSSTGSVLTFGSVTAALLVGGVVLAPFAAGVGAVLELVGVSGCPLAPATEPGAPPYGGIMDTAAGRDGLIA